MPRRRARSTSAGNVLDLHGLRPRRPDEDDARARPHLCLDAVRLQRVVVGRFDPKPLQKTVAKHARGPIDGVGHKDMIAGFDEAQQRERHRPEPGRRKNRPRCAGESSPSVFEVGDRRRTRGPVEEPVALVLEVVERWVYRGRPAVKRRIDEPDLFGRIAPEHRHSRGKP